MVLPKSLASYSECENYFAKALAAPKGIAITLESKAAATRLRLKLNNYRVLLRRRNEEIYPFADPRHGGSPYDELLVRIEPDTPERIIIEPKNLKPLKLEIL